MPTQDSPRCLIIGAGAIGQVYAHHLIAGGAEVHFYAKPKYEQSLKAGMRLYRWKKKRRPPQAVLEKNFGVLCDQQSIAALRWEYVFLCISSVALQSGPWLKELACHFGNATIVVLQAGQSDFDFVASSCPGSELISGMIPFTSYQAPLPTDPFAEPGIAYWIPPFTKVPFTGRTEDTTVLLALLKRGGMPTKGHSDVRTAVAFGQALLQTQILALECANWSISQLVNDRDLMKLSLRCMREASALAAHNRQTSIPFLNRRLGRRSLGFFLSSAKHLAPMDLDAFFQFHYTKVHDQSMAGLANWIAEGPKANLAVDGLMQIQERLLGAREA